MGNMSKEQMQSNFNMMNPEMMKNASNMFANMSDSQIQMHMAQMGMPNMDPQAFRSMCKTMSEMDDSQLNNMKNMAQSNFNTMNANNNNYNNNYTNTTNNSNTTNKIEGTIVGQVTKMKEEGNTLFKQNKYDEAIKKYYETIEEIKTSTDKDKYKNELAELEKQCRLNIANCKLKTKDFDGVINECSIVLESNKCFKAYYRMGLALFQKKKYDKAFRYLDNANAIGTPSEKTAVEPHLKECKEKLDEIKKKEREERKKKEKEKEKEKEENKIINENKEIKEEKKEVKEVKEKKENNNNKNDIKIENNNEEEIKKEDKKNNKLDNLREMIEKEKEKNKKDKEEKEDEIEDDIKVEDTKDSPYSKNTNNNNNNNNFNNFNNNFNINNNPPKYNQDYINQARNQLNNMSDEQLNAMIGNMKQMDNQTLKNLMAAQGMNVSDQQIEIMKASLSPELIKMAQNQNFPNPMANTNNMNNTNNNTNINTNNNININNSAQPPQMQMPNINNMDFSQMMDFIKKNPQFLNMVSPQLSQMMGGKNINPEIMMKSMENLLWMFSLPGRIKRFMLSWRGICLIILIIAVFYGIFKR